MTATEAVLASDNAVELFTKNFENKHKLGNVSSLISHEKLQQMAGRVTRGSKEKDFEYLQLHGPAVKKFAWCMGGDGLSVFLEKSNLDALRSLGTEDKWIRKKLEDGEHFRLGVFYMSTDCVSATWEGVLSLIDKHYPKSISIKIHRHADSLKQMSFDEIEARARLSFLRGASYFDINESAVGGYSADDRFMTEERFLQCDGTLEESRGFLYNKLGLSKLFDGSGLTKDSSGQLCVPEYLQLNIPVRDIPEFRYLDLPIDMADIMPNA
ncbi:unnamed protein product [Rotaria magnacalcarata]|uniref:Uncharacterized protein n=1 Tax=Rotaria magnacalcarata TaxID=392030 RepID=A0A814H2B1_9BILA|nr:unnamed protein product [Rotaria magnacalcarata]CAF1403947.1 unnamed protein product [Rotaria magnacalcarata]CAF2054537.1 unnamed protein product [Rotaria magnacalcarata]CAF2062146.1 unnamed protein product [Rotaria magnacalcarata]CAF2260101.1 unnamed protein product [Rotaria magnacalcarata]